MLETVRPRATAVEALLFDLGGVLVEIDFQRAFEAWASAAQVPVSHIASRFSFDDAYEAHERGEIVGAAYFAHLRRSLAVALTDEELLAGWNAIFLGPMAGIDALLGRLAKHLPLYVFSNTNPSHRAFWQFRYGKTLAPLTGVFCSCDLGARKPAGHAFLEVCRRIGIQPSRIGFFDDRPENVLGARRAGLQACQAASAAEIRRALVQELRIEGTL